MFRLRSSLLCVAALCRMVVTDISVQHISPIFEGLGPIGCPETSANYYRSSLHNIAEGRRSYLYCGGRKPEITQRFTCDQWKTWWEIESACDAGSVEATGNY
jgi:hypothetical protein